MQPLATVTVTRPWHWGIVIVSDPDLGGQIPEVNPDLRVTANENGLVILVRHAQDIPSFEGDFDWAESAVSVCHSSAAPGDREGKTKIFEGTLATPSGRLWVGDADDDVVMTGLTSASSLRVLAQSDDLDSPRQIWIDIWPA